MPRCGRAAAPACSPLTSRHTAEATNRPSSSRRTYRSTETPAGERMHHGRAAGGGQRSRRGVGSAAAAAHRSPNSRCSRASAVRAAVSVRSTRGPRRTPMNPAACARSCSSLGESALGADEHGDGSPARGRDLGEAQRGGWARAAASWRSPGRAQELRAASPAASSRGGRLRPLCSQAATRDRAPVLELARGLGGIQAHHAALGEHGHERA